MSSRDEFGAATRRTLAERAGQRCANPDCGRATSGPSDDGSGESTVLGRAAHITAAAAGGPRYDPTLTAEQRAHPDNGIWLCAICADRIDKSENEREFPAELLQCWKQFHESATGTDHASRENRHRYPLRRLSVIDFAGVQGRADLTFGALTLVMGTLRLSHTLGDLLRIFSDRETFERTLQPTSGDSWEHSRLPLPDGRECVITVTSNRPRSFSEQGKLRLRLSDNREFIVTIGRDGATLSHGDAPVPVFSPVIRTVSPGMLTGPELDREADHEDLLSRYFGMNRRELKSCMEGAPTDQSLFDYDYRFDDQDRLEVRVRRGDLHRTVRRISSGEQSGLILDVAVRVAAYWAKVHSTILLLDQTKLSMDPHGWQKVFEWIERESPPFQTVVDVCYEPRRSRLSRALYYEVVGTDMEVCAFEPKTLR